MAPLLILRDPDATKKLLEAILDSPGGKRSLSRLARTCKAICDPALNILWRDLDSIVPLIGLFPNNILKRARRPGLGLSKNPSEQDWVRLLAYGERVRSIAYTESSNNVSTSIFPILEDHRPRTYILPKLTSITWRAETPAGLDRCLIFLNPELKHVTLEIGVRFNNAHDFLVQLSGKTHLSSFSFSSPTHLPDDFTEILRRQTGLEKVSLSAPGALSAQVGKWVASLHKLRSLQLDLTGRGIVAVEGFFDEISPRSGYTTPSSVGGTDSGVFSGEEIDFSDVRKSALRLTGDAPARGVCSQLKQLHLTGEAANIATFLRHLTSRLVQLELVIEDPPDKNDWQDLSNTICEQFAGWLQSLRITATGSSKFTELVRSTSRDVPLRHLPLKHLSLMPRLARFEVDLPESVIFHDSDVAHLARMCPNIEILRLCPVARFTTSPPSLSLEGLTPLTATCRRLHTLAVVVNARETDETQKVLSSSDVSSRSLLRLHFGHSWIKDPFQTSLVLSNLAPHLESLKWFNDKNRAVVEANAQGWQKVSDYLPHLQKLRIGERVAAALAAQQHIPEPPPPPPPAPETCEKAIDATPVMVDSGVLVRPRVADFAVQSSPQLVDEEVEAKPEFHSIEIDATPVIVDQEVLASPTVSDAIIDVRPSTSSQGVDPIIILKADEVIVTDGLPESMSDTSSPSSSTSSSSEDLHPANYVVPSITGMFSFVREVFLCYPLYLSLRLLNVSLATMGAKKPDELLSAEKLTAAALEGDYHGEAESEKRIPMESPDVLLSPLSPRIGDRAAVLDIVPPVGH
ncbi:hypothetical protein JAAARDRAFT_120795 [Jaapia argillacea MUCL 33604]|uniref:F-box domain-containing protein n=1 Tax=Jaapia argillacea MUCL 33604 TaxID=933084 RepID=A0A067QIL4_9AGAM|nr:hypothetical protein JAAARDRAFT_120795 [Jaapia argillacea MUCL 33604]